MTNSRKLKRAAVATVLAVLLVIPGCAQAERVSYNISNEADNFNITRRLVVLNTVTDTPVLELIGNFSLTVDDASQKLDITVKEDDGTYKKHFVGLNAATVVYTVEDLTGAEVSNTRFQISYLPESIIPIELKDGTN